MKRTYFLITNVSGLKYWSYLGTLLNTNGSLRQMVKKWGNIYVNENGGWFNQECVKVVHDVRIQIDFPHDLNNY